MLATNVFAEILAQAVKAAGGIETTVQVILEQEVYGLDVGEFAAVNLSANVVLPEHFPKLAGAEKRAQPVPLVFVSYK